MVGLHLERHRGLAVGKDDPSDDAPIHRYYIDRFVQKYREPVLDVLEAVTGNRNHYAMMRIGGVRRDIP